jgi:hypothetical protein
MKNPAKTFEVSISANIAEGFLPVSVGFSPMGRGDRVNAELQHAPVAIEMRQVGVPASAGLSTNRGKATSEFPTSYGTPIY